MSDEPRPLVDNAASPKQVRAARKRARYSQRVWHTDLRNVIDTVAGRRVLWTILTEAKVFHDVDVEVTNIAMKSIGKRSIGLFLIAELEAAQPNALELLRAQYHKDRQNP